MKQQAMMRDDTSEQLAKDLTPSSLLIKEEEKQHKSEQPQPNHIEKLVIRDEELNDNVIIEAAEKELEIAGKLQRAKSDKETYEESHKENDI